MYLLSEYGITAVNYESVLRYMNKRFSLDSVTRANEMVSHLTITDLGEMPIRFRAGDTIGYDSKNTFILDEQYEEKGVLRWLVSPYFFRDEIIPYRQEMC